MRCFMRQVSWRSGKGYKQVDIMPIPTEGIHRGARGKRRHASSLVQQRLNGKHSRRYLVQLVNANFGAGDWLLTLTYAPEYLPASFADACRRMENFIDRLRAACKRLDLPAPAYIWVTEGGTEEAEAAGEAKRYHHHAFLRCALDARAITELWCTGRGKHCRPLGRVHLSLAQPEQGSLEAWADYCVKTKHCRRKWRQSLGLKKPVVTVNDSKYTPAAPLSAPCAPARPTAPPFGRKPTPAGGAAPSASNTTSTSAGIMSGWNFGERGTPHDSTVPPLPRPRAGVPFRMRKIPRLPRRDGRRARKAGAGSRCERRGRRARGQNTP